MKFCQDEGRTHFLKAWPDGSFDLEISSGGAATMYFLAKGTPEDFRVTMNGAPLVPELCRPCRLPDLFFRWMEVAVPAGREERRLSIMPGVGELALDLGTGRPVVRVGDDTPPTALQPSYDDPGLPAERILALLPPKLSTLQNPDWQEAWTLARWVHTAWPYRNTFQGRYYCPWQAEEILQWGPLGKGPDGDPVIAMCVHYAVTLQQACMALGTPARVLPLVAHINSDNGHFVAEVWSRSLQKWVLIDAQSGLCFRDESGLPLCALEVARLEDPRHRARCGADAGDPIPGDFPWPLACGSDVFRHIGVWRRADFHSHPEAAPVGHGTTAYAETDLLWLRKDGRETPPMFPHILTEADYLAPPREKA